MLKKIFFFRLFSIFFILFFFEIGSLVYCKIFDVCKNPTYSLSNKTARHFVDINKSFGAWHESNTSYNHKSECFDVTYKFNSYGARDKERSKIGENRTILIGDSFVEGYGVEFENTISQQLEILSGNDFLNFGTSGHFGTTQYRLLYETLAKNFEHERLIVILSVNNDFEDDSLEFGKSYHQNRYRPYLVKNDDKFETIYYDEKKFNNKNISEKNLFINFINNYTYSYNLLRYFYQKIKYLYEVENYKKSLETVQGISKNKNFAEQETYYDRYSKESFEIASFNILELNNIAKKNNVEFILISVGFEKELNNKFYNTKKTKLEKNLEILSFENQFKYFDLTRMVNVNSNINDLFFECDHHYNSKGNKILSEIIFQKLFKS